MGRKEKKTAMTEDMRTDGDCFRCCVATVLRMNYDDVPEFNKPDEDQWVGNLSRWCRGRGLSMVMVRPHGETVWAHFLSHGLWIAGGPGPRGVDHAVVYDGPNLLHDPHRSREGLLEVTEAIVLFRSDSVYKKER